MPEITVVAPPPLGRVSNVELIHTGTWDASTGEATFTPEDLAAAVAALECPAVRRPFLKLGHTPDPRPGQPAIGFIANLAVAENGHTLVGDYVGMPGWLVTADDNGDSVLTSAYPDRSIEGWFDFKCQLGHTHPFVLTAVALLGQDAPAVGTLQSLQDLADLYGVTAASLAGAGKAVAVPVHASHAPQEDSMPAPSPALVAAGVSTEDVRRAFYATPAGAGWDIWIEEMQLTPEQQLIVVDDAAGTRSRVPIVIGEGDGDAAVTFGTPVPVVIRYEDTPAAVAASGVIRFSRDESRPGRPASPPTAAPAAPTTTEPAPAARPTTATSAAAGDNAPTRGAGMDPAKLREALDLQPNAPDDEVTAAIAAAGFAPPTTATTATTTQPAPDTTDNPVDAAAAASKNDAILLDPVQYKALRASAMRGEEAWRKMRETECEAILDAAIKAGKFPPSRRDHWKALWAADPDGTKAAVEKLAANVIPVMPAGFPGTVDEDEVDIVYASMYGDQTKAGGRRG